MTVSDFAEVTKDKPEKSLVTHIKKTSGRNNQGKITVRHIGGGSKKKYRIIDFKRNKDGIPAKVSAIEYDPNRTANIALLFYKDGEKRYILAPHGVKPGDMLMSGETAEVRPGNALPLKNIPVGSEIHNVEMKPGRAASWYVQPEMWRSLWLRNLNTPPSGFHPARCVWFP